MHNRYNMEKHSEGNKHSSKRPCLILTFLLENKFDIYTTSLFYCLPTGQKDGDDFDRSAKTNYRFELAPFCHSKFSVCNFNSQFPIPGFQ